MEMEDGGLELGNMDRGFNLYVVPPQIVCPGFREIRGMDYKFRDQGNGREAQLVKRTQF